MIIEPMVTRSQIWSDKTGWEDTCPARSLIKLTKFVKEVRLVTEVESGRKEKEKERGREDNRSGVSV